MKTNALAAVKFKFETITPAVAAKYLATSKGNRRLKKSTVACYAREMTHGEWLTNHQGLAFDERGTLIDGHHRLRAIELSQATVQMLISTGWPHRLNGARQKTMDTVDRGCVRSLRDTLELQHGITNAAGIVQLASAITQALLPGRSTMKQTPATTLAIAGQFQEPMQWFCEHQATTIGLRNRTTGAIIVLGLTVWPDKTKAFYEQYKTGLGLRADSPVHHLRNYMLSGVTTASDRSTQEKIRNATAHHLELFVQGKPCGSLVTTSKAALNRLILAQGDRAQKLCALFDVKLELETEPERAKEAEKPADNSKLQPGSAEAIEIGRTLTDGFTPTDLAARLDRGQAPLFLADWKARGWIERAGFGQYRRTEKFGKMVKTES